MQEFTYTIQDELGIHARPAGLLAKEAKKYTSTITLSNGTKQVKMAQMMALMGMGIKKGSTVVVQAEGEDEAAAAEAMQKIFVQNL